MPLVWIRPFDDELTPINNRGEPWNPLTDDRDALRLAVKRRMSIDFDEDDDVAVIDGIDPSAKYVVEPHRDDLNAAVRRAIVRAAAAMAPKAAT